MDFDVQFASASSRKMKKEEDGVLTVDVYHTDKEIIVKSTVAGITSKDLDISVTKDTVTIKGSRKNPDKVKPSDYDYREVFWGKFSRSIILPEDVDPDKARASLKNGILTIKMMKQKSENYKKVSP